MKHLVPTLSGLRKVARPNIDLQRLMQEPWGTETGVALLTKSNELVFSDAVPYMSVLFAMLLDSHAGFGGSAFGRVVVACPNHYMIGQIEQLSG
jgi:hypothetical protein